MIVQQILSSLTVAFIFIGIFLFRSPMSGGEMMMAILAWYLIYYGAETAPLIGVKFSSRTYDLIELFIQFIGWFFWALALLLFFA